MLLIVTAFDLSEVKTLPLDKPEYGRTKSEENLDYLLEFICEKLPDIFHEYDIQNILTVENDKKVVQYSEEEISDAKIFGAFGY